MRHTKRILAVVAACACMLALSPGAVYAQETGEGSAAELTVHVPSVHTATLRVGANGSVSVNGETYAGAASGITVELPRLEDVAWEFCPADGYMVEAVLYNGTDVTAELRGNTYTASGVSEDGTVVEVTFAKREAGTDPTATLTPTGKPAVTPTPTSGGTSGKGSGSSGSSGRGTAVTGQTAKTTVTKTTATKTGDNTPVAPCTAALLAAVAAVGLCTVKLRKRRK